MARHSYYCPIRWADMDVYGVVNNVAFLRYLEEARVDFVFRMAPTERDSFFRDGSVVVRHEIEYKNRLVHRREPVEIEMWVSHLQTSTVTIGYLVKDGRHVYATASTVMAPFDFRSQRPRRLTEAETEFFGKYVEEDVASG
jgi:acyl-CoA thioester hydrolase